MQRTRIIRACFRKHRYADSLHLPHLCQNPISGWCTIRLARTPNRCVKVAARLAPLPNDNRYTTPVWTSSCKNQNQWGGGEKG